MKSPVSSCWKLRNLYQSDILKLWIYTRIGVDFIPKIKSPSLFISFAVCAVTNDVKRNDVNETEKKRTQERIDSERKREETRIMNERQKKESSTLENQKKRNDVNNSRTEEKEIRKERNVQIQKDQNEVKVEKKVETNRQENRNYNPNQEQKRTDSRNTDQRINQDRKTSERTKTR